MNEIVIRFIVLKKDDYFDVKFDTRLSFIDNFILLRDLYPIDVKQYHIYDLENQAFLSLNKPIYEYNFAYYTRLYLF